MYARFYNKPHTTAFIRTKKNSSSKRNRFFKSFNRDKDFFVLDESA